MRQRRDRLVGFLVTWDVDSSDAAACGRLRRFVFGYESVKNGKAYRYPGFVEREGVRHVGQSVLFVSRPRLAELQTFLREDGIAHVVTEASLGSIVAT